MMCSSLFCVGIFRTLTSRVINCRDNNTLVFVENLEHLIHKYLLLNAYNSVAEMS